MGTKLLDLREDMKKAETLARLEMEIVERGGSGLSALWLLADVTTRQEIGLIADILVDLERRTLVRP
jgi:hypothetical protein